VVSAETGCTNKDDSASFEYGLQLSKVRPDESIFIDNSRVNLVAAAALGMNVVHFDDSKNNVAELAQHLRKRCRTKQIERCQTLRSRGRAGTCCNR